MQHGKSLNEVRRGQAAKRIEQRSGGLLPNWRSMRDDDAIKNARITEGESNSFVRELAELRDRVSIYVAEATATRKVCWIGF
jgi:hypothetical protein